VLKAVLDANVFISALLIPGKPKDLVRSWLQGEFQLAYPDKLIEELRGALSKRKLQGRLQADDVSDLISIIESDGIRVDQLGEIPTVCNDAADNEYLACAAVIAADYLVTGDGGVLRVGEFAGTKIVNTAQFLDALAK
jgi:putative PIN family toxin of toxin-antitoxin system